ncbi:MAG TPA: hypothetical protein V6C81_00990 [Planktothrix sp.]|jgi:hypothetical protein
MSNPKALDATNNGAVENVQRSQLSQNNISSLYNGFQETFQPQTNENVMHGDTMSLGQTQNLYPDDLGLPSGSGSSDTHIDCSPLSSTPSASDSMSSSGEKAYPNVDEFPLSGSTSTDSSTPASSSTTGDSSPSSTPSDGSTAKSGSHPKDGTYIDGNDDNVTIDGNEKGPIVVKGNDDNITVDGDERGRIVVKGNDDTVTIDGGQQPVLDPPGVVSPNASGGADGSSTTGADGSTTSNLNVDSTSPTSSASDSGSSTSGDGSASGGGSGSSQSHHQRDGVYVDGNNDNVTVDGPHNGPVVVKGDNDNVTVDDQPPPPPTSPPSDTGGSTGTGSGTGDGGTTGSGTGDTGTSGTGTGDSGTSGSGSDSTVQQIEQELTEILQQLQQLLGGDSGSGSTGTGDGGSTTGGGGDGSGTSGSGGSSTGSGGGDGGSTGSGTGSGTGSLDMSSLFTAGDSGVTSAEMQHAVTLANDLPTDMKQALLNSGVSMTMLSGFQGGPEGENDGTSGDFYVDSGMADQAEIHELYEMYGQVTSSGGGSWSDSQAVSLSDSAMTNINNGTAAGGNPGDLNDTVGQYTGDGDLMSNSFVADFFASHPGLDQDTVGQSVLQSTDADAPQLEQYIAQQQGLSDADSSSNLSTTSMETGSSSSSSASNTNNLNSAQWSADGTELAQVLGACGCHCYLAAGQDVEF